MRLVDRLQDYGIVAIAVTEPRADGLHILNWVMSCRVFARRLEHAMVEQLWHLADRFGLDTLHIEFVPSPKNAIVPGILEKLNFQAESLADGGKTEFTSRERSLRETHHMTIQIFEEVQ